MRSILKIILPEKAVKFIESYINGNHIYDFSAKSQIFLVQTQYIVSYFRWVTRCIAHYHQKDVFAPEASMYFGYF